MVLIVILIPLLPLLVSGEWQWLAAWSHALVGISGFAASRVLAARRNPGIIAERAQLLSHENVKSWDRILAPIVALGGAVVLLLAGLEARVDGVPAMSAAVQIGALAFLVSGYALGSYALIENPFFSGVARIQTERGHRVVTTGPYRWVRHPGYASALVAYVATPVLLGSAWAIVPTLTLCGCLVLRTALEDRMLLDELEGYRAYALKVHHRLVPLVW
jgi:protein-S-isoprenylcysteine O-methyltransferase Ste14